MTNQNNTISSNIVVSDYVTYKDTTYIVVELRGNLAVILNPLQGNTKLQVSVDKLIKRNNGNTVVVEYRGNEYIVTHSMMIISLRTGRVMNWASTDGNHDAIIRLRDGIIGSELMESYDAQQREMEAGIEECSDVTVEVKTVMATHGKTREVYVVSDSGREHFINPYRAAKHLNVVTADTVLALYNEAFWLFD
jgi:hypothetical protein